MKVRISWLIAAMMFAFGVLQHCAAGQGITTGGISATIIDPSGALIPKAEITVVNEATGTKLKQASLGDGSFAVQALPVGYYTVTIEAAGFNALKIEHVQVAIGMRDLGKQTLKLGTSQTVQVSEEGAQLLQTDQAQVSETFSPQQLQGLPFGGGFDQVALLEPGVVMTHSNSFSNNNGASFSSQGTRGRSNNFELDGQSNNDNSVAGPQVFFGNQDALQGIQVITNNFAAQYGRNSGSVVNYLTRSGTNRWHGAVFEFYEGNWGESFNQSAKLPFLGFCAPGQNPLTDGCSAPVLARFVTNRFGGAVGGPIIKDKLWGFGSTYFNRFHEGGGLSISSPNSLTPTPAGLQTLQSAYPNNPAVTALVNNGPYSIKTGNPKVFGTTVMRTVSNGTTSTAVEFGQIQRGVPSQDNDQEDMGRLDWQPTTRDHLFARYFYQDDPFINGGGTVSAGSWYDVPDTAHSIGADWTHTFSPTWVNQIRYSFQQTNLTFQSGAQSNCTITTPDLCTSSVSLGTGNLGFGYANNIPQGRIVKNTEVQDNAIYTHGKNTLLFGGEWEYQNSPNGFLPNYNGTYTFGSFNNFLQSSGTIQLSNGDFTTRFTEPDAAAYVQDDWKVLPTMTLNLGLRWEFFGQAINILHNETVARESNPATAFWNTSLPLSERTFPAVDAVYHNFQPRIGFAWTPAQLQNRLVVRGGFAINSDPAFYNIFLNSATAAPVVNAGPAVACGGTCIPSGGITGAQTRALNLASIPLGGNPNARNYTTVPTNFHNPYLESWQLGFEYGIGSNIVLDIRYVGNHQIGNFQSLDANPDMLGTAQAFPTLINPSQFCTTPGAIGYGRTSCGNGNIRLRANTAFSNFNALEFKAETRNWHGLIATFNYTYSRTIDNSSEIFGTFGGGNTVTFAQNPFNTNDAERAESGISIPNTISASFTYQVPFFKNQNNWKGKLLGGFQLNGIYTFDTGQPTTPFEFQYGAFGFPEMTSYCDETFNNSFSSSVSSCRPVLLNRSAPIQATAILDGAYSDGIAQAGTYYDLQSWINYLEGAVAAPTPVNPSSQHWAFNNQAIANVRGNPFPGVGRSVLGSQNYNNLDASIFKNTQLKEGITLQLSITAYNSLNRQYFGSLDPEVDDLSFQDVRYCGTGVCNQGGSNRNIELGARIIF